MHFNLFFQPFLVTFFYCNTRTLPFLSITLYVTSSCFSFSLLTQHVSVAITFINCNTNWFDCIGSNARRSNRATFTHRLIIMSQMVDTVCYDVSLGAIEACIFNLSVSFEVPPWGCGSWAMVMNQAEP